MSQTIICPHCQTEIAIEEALTHQITSQLESDFAKKLAAKEQEIIKKAQEEALKDTAAKLKLLEEDNAAKEKKLAEARQAELEVRKLMNKLEDDKKAFELEKQRQLDAERVRIIQKVETQMAEQQRLKDMEKEKVINDLKKALDEAKRKADQGSQQTQGEVLELEIEELLRQAFPHDTIEPVGKGVNGADIRQIVKSPGGTTCGTILWESKQTKHWKEEWLSKLKTDLRNEKSDIPALVTSAYATEKWSGIEQREGVWVCTFSLVIPLAMLLRKTLLDVGYQKAVSQHQGKKADLIYEYITGHEFRQQVEALVEVYGEMTEQVQKERIAFEKSWKQRESQIRRLSMSTVSIFGSIQGLAGSAAIPELKGLDLVQLPE